ncbi:hypothetical protein MUU72_29870 [Streptomyces sp. RS10V-4]|uniref:hypothetical protein n=1 Tax=Streptomyces rhizoryzae TaxID=2932493 RepID=UPI002003EE95|nr:hypothetical protein [Streptomyces rhizoryzae]MCK7627255.1 hypothetical protein [Streptomyces rhizoryzae]
MGYDFYIQTADGKPAAGDENYFRIPWTAMPRTLDAMANFRMLVELPVPSFPSLSAYGLTDRDFQPDAQRDQATSNRIAEYRAAYQAVKDASEPQPAGIPSYKLTYNGGFLVALAEITAALSTYEAHPHVDIAEVPVGNPTWRHWVAFLRRAKKHGGLRAH